MCGSGTTTAKQMHTFEQDLLYSKPNISDSLLQQHQDVQMEIILGVISNFKSVSPTVYNLLINLCAHLLTDRFPVQNCHT
jgi:hypothetical protein